LEFIQQFIGQANKEGYTNIASVDISKIEFEESLRALCDQNACGHFNKSWTCPPACGKIEELRNKVLSFKDGILVQKVYTLEDSFDFEGMMEGQSNFDKLFSNMMDFNFNNNNKDHYSLKAGSCHLCETCTYPDKPCIYPDKARPSIEACGINVTSLCGSCGIPYMNGKNTVSYVALFLF
jgi:predicted metal-binding protein